MATVRDTRTASWYKEDNAVALFNDGETLCIECAIKRYKDALEDIEGNPLNPVYDGSPNLHGQYCMGECYQLLREGKRDEYDNRLCDAGCECYKSCPIEGYCTNYDYYNEFGYFPSDDEDDDYDEYDDEYDDDEGEDN